MAGEDVLCTKCGHVGGTRTVTKGSFLIEIVAWLAFLVPGIIYSLWRLSSRHEVCPKCGNRELVPRSSPIAQKFIRENLPDLPAVQAHQPSKAAHSLGHALGQAVGKALKK